MEHAFDHIVVGAGSAGCALAGRLAALTDWRIAVVEAGPSDRHRSNGEAPPTPERESAGVFQVNMRGARRWSAADACLRPALASGRVQLLTGAEVRRVLIDGAVATGIELDDGQRIVARDGVTLSAGAIESPALLMRSGLGPAAHLRDRGIAVQRDMPGIGENLQDHPAVGLHHAGPRSGYGLTARQLPGWALAPLRYLMQGKGRLASNTVEVGAFLRVSDGDGPPEAQVHFIPFHMGWKGRAITWGSGYYADVCLCRPKSRGRLSLKADHRPEIDLGLGADPDDVTLLARAVTRLRQLLDDAPFGAARAEERHPGRHVTGDALIDDIRHRMGTAYHPVGTLRMGTAPDAPVTPDLALRGMANLWVADASVMPALTSANTNAPSMMIGWRAGAMIARAATQEHAA
ncbi:GMC family oxidoreductase [Aestuariicoccus sp. MJ-SS9]|uniref:GMC family oxidoreductase n=1 Tax=Aestuariicoccus sp. MJ-SS9 TaxID=3079855 RepID=UPI002913DF9E|nr:GMC oxidoreductase [Aestuariicoccus sp. MJ-SS9]MDU8910834.1 GMC family oxidoreductase N-terminal domain-containing protein [Aestuariicoccus sp. MJ-SS9]